jgi:hypothetical protein
MLFARIPLPDTCSVTSLLTGALLKQALVNPHWLSYSASLLKRLLPLFPIPYSFRAKCEKSDFNSPRSPIHHSVFIIPLFPTYSFLFVPQNRIPNPQSKIRNPQFSNLWYTTRRAPLVSLVSLGATVSGNCFDHYRSMPDGNQIGLFYCQTPRFRKEAPLPAGNGITPAR